MGNARIFRRIILGCVASCALTGGALVLDARAQSGSPSVTTPLTDVMGVRTSASPLRPGDTSRPIFNTAEPSYARGDEATRHANTVVAEVDGRTITLGEVGDEISRMPSSIAAMPFEALFLSVVDQLTRREGLAIRAQQLGLEQDPVIRRRMKAAADMVLGNEMLRRDITASITEQMLRDRYERDFAGRPGPEEVRARVIMVPTEAEAAALIAELKAGADFASLARRVSKDTTAKVGGDLGYMRQVDLNPEVGALAFSLPVGQINALPLRRAGSWFIVKVEDRRKQPTPSFHAMRKQIMDGMVRENVPATVAGLLAHVTVRKYDMNGNEERLMNAAVE